MAVLNNLFIPRALSSHTEVAALNYLPTQSEYKAMIMLDFTCQCCGFVGVSKKEVPSAGLEFVDINEKLTLLCIMCAQAQLLTRPVLSSQNSKQFNHGKLVYCPDIEQGKIISVVRDIYALSLYQRKNKNPQLKLYIDELRNSYIDVLTDRCSNIPLLKIKNNDLEGYAALYKFSPSSFLKHEKNIFGGIRYIPDDVVFSHVIKYWLNTSYHAVLTAF